MREQREMLVPRLRKGIQGGLRRRGECIRGEHDRYDGIVCVRCERGYRPPTSNEPFQLVARMLMRDNVVVDMGVTARRGFVEPEALASVTGELLSANVHRVSPLSPCRVPAPVCRGIGGPPISADARTYSLIISGGPLPLLHPPEAASCPRQY